jgi:hypothetical protein
MKTKLIVWTMVVAMRCGILAQTASQPKAVPSLPAGEAKTNVVFLFRMLRVADAGSLPEFIRGIISALGKAPGGRTDHGHDRGVVLVDGAAGETVLWADLLPRWLRLKWRILHSGTCPGLTGRSWA